MFIYFGVVFFDSYIKSQEINFGLLHTNLSTSLVGISYTPVNTFRSHFNRVCSVCSVRIVYKAAELHYILNKKAFFLFFFYSVQKFKSKQRDFF